MTATTHPDIRTLSAAIEARDTEGILALYDTHHSRPRPPPAAPTVYHGATEIGDYYRDVCRRNIAHQVRDLVATDTGLAFTQHCRYPEGARVVCATLATLHDGKIKNQTAVQVWDS